MRLSYPGGPPRLSTMNEVTVETAGSAWSKVMGIILSAGLGVQYVNLRRHAMKLNKKLQLGLLFVLYLSRSGKTTTASAAEGLGVSAGFLTQVAVRLRRAGLIRATKGPYGGSELVGSPTVGQVFAALSPVQLLAKQEVTRNTTSGQERRTLNHLARNLTLALEPLMNRKVKSFGADIVAQDTASLNRPSPSARVN